MPQTREDFEGILRQLREQEASLVNRTGDNYHAPENFRLELDKVRQRIAEVTIRMNA